MAWEFSTTAEFEGHLAWMRELLDDEIIPLESGGGERDLEPLIARVKERGLWRPSRDEVERCLMYEVLGRSWLAPRVFGMDEPDAGNLALLVEHGSAWARQLSDGSIRSALAMTEPTAGSDPTLTSTTAERVGDQWVVNGAKSFVANGAIADIFVVLAVTNPDVHPTQGTSMIVVPSATPGVTVVRDIATIDEPSNEVRFTDVTVPYDNVVGTEGDGLAIAQAHLAPVRLHAVMRWIGQAQRAFDMLCERAVSRYTHGSVLADKQTIQNWVAESKAAITAARLMALHAAWKLDADGSEAASGDIAMAKYVTAATLHDVVDRAIQVHGSLGLSTDMPLERMYRTARAARIDHGPDEVHKVSVARDVLRDYKPVEVPTELRALHDRALGEADRQRA